MQVKGHAFSEQGRDSGVVSGGQILETCQRYSQWEWHFVIGIGSVRGNRVKEDCEVVAWATEKMKLPFTE